MTNALGNIRAARAVVLSAHIIETICLRCARETDESERVALMEQLEWHRAALKDNLAQVG